MPGARSRGSIGFVALAAIWGCTYALVKVAVDGGVPPAGLAFLRVAVGAALVGLVQPAGTRAALRGRWPAVAVFALVDIAIPFLLIAVVEQHVASSLVAIVIAASPLMLAALAFRFARRERPTRRGWIGLLVGFAGVTVLVGVDGAADPWPTLGLVAAAAGCAIGPLILGQRLGDIDARFVMGPALWIAAAALAPAALLSPPSATPSASALGAVAALAVVCTAGAYVLYGALIADIGPARAIVVTYLTPLVAVAVAWSALGEPPGAGLVAGMPLILGGSWLATRRGGVDSPQRHPTRLAQPPIQAPGPPP